MNKGVCMRRGTGRDGTKGSKGVQRVYLWKIRGREKIFIARRPSFPSIDQLVNHAYNSAPYQPSTPL